VKREDFTSDAHSIVLLPRLAALDTGVALEMAQYNALVVQAFADVAAAQQQAQQEGPLADGLPLMHQRGIEAQAAGAAASQPSSSLLQSLLRSDVAPAAIRRSYPTVQSLLLSLPAHTFDAGRIPVLHPCDPHGSPFQLNSYAYDFYKHGIYRSIVRVNRLPDSRAFALLSDWQSTLKTVAQAVETLAADHPEGHTVHTLVATMHFVKDKFSTAMEHFKRHG
jgi:hypothetical protein